MAWFHEATGRRLRGGGVCRVVVTASTYARVYGPVGLDFSKQPPVALLRVWQGAWAAWLYGPPGVL